MDLRQLNHLIAVAEHQSFSAAARALHTVQSNVSTHVAKLEKELGAALIDRHTMQPTAEGRAVLERARRIRTELQAINDDIVSMRHEVAGEVRIGCIGTTGRWMASPLLGRLAERHPALRPVLVDATTTSLTPRVLDGDLDMAIVNTPVVEAGLESEPLFDEERIIVAPADHPLADRETIDVADLAEHPVMLTPRGTTFRDAIDQELAAAGVRLTAAAEVDGLRLLASLAYQGYAPALLPASTVSGYPSGDWSLVHVEGLARRSVGLVRNRRTTPSMPIRAAREVVLNVIREIAPRQPGIHVTLDG
ncbi:MAG: LysR family transcriptional regulator [Actinomycetota bacterium]|jgi:LysR family hydrogen peroxide-inducible transcriptional activator|nr:LysR family transcriptional regulator [Acidimicrobiales bacterium]MEC8815659.1 LysR family transcriptional regulator [Actinomycetota bacterium]MEC8969892.1 LysR family transcriptional regulator [Actinomycetota bacterium]MEC8982718.1 LysR family transcriptional regulator [Actinomycetota bacterium]MEC9057479.1 LysR family transcriptional regulator [Actinomycetota bacterium]